MIENEKIWAIKDGYLVNRDGSIYKLYWYKKNVLHKAKLHKRPDGYMEFSGGLVHRFIAECFIPNPENLPCINHKDENKTNNHVNNLEWCNHKYNNNYGTSKKRIGEKLSKKVLQYTKEGEFVKEWDSTIEIQRQLGFKQSNISACCRGAKHYKSAYGFVWSYTPKNC